MIQNNIIFSLFIFSAENYDGINAQEILDSYLEGGIVGKEKKKKEENKLSFGEKENERFKQKKNEEEKERYIYNYIKSFKNSMFILNKIDHYNSSEKIKKWY